MVFSISHRRAIFTSAIQPVLSFKDENSNRSKPDFHTHSYHWVRPLEHVNCFKYINITVPRPWKQVFWDVQGAYDQIHNFFRWWFSIIATKLLICLIQLINSDTWRSIFLRTLLKWHSDTHRSSAFGYSHDNNCCKINVLGNGFAIPLNY